MTRTIGILNLGWDIHYGNGDNYELITCNSTSINWRIFSLRNYWPTAYQEALMSMGYMELSLAKNGGLRNPKELNKNLYPVATNAFMMSKKQRKEIIILR